MVDKHRKRLRAAYGASLRGCGEMLIAWRAALSPERQASHVGLIAAR
jgi:hypothetical protein